MLDSLNKYWEPTGQKPDAILFSSGGNDIVGDQFAIYLDFGRIVGCDAIEVAGEGRSRVFAVEFLDKIRGCLCQPPLLRHVPNDGGLDCCSVRPMLGRDHVTATEKLGLVAANDAAIGHLTRSQDGANTFEEGPAVAKSARIAALGREVAESGDLRPKD